MQFIDICGHLINFETINVILFYTLDGDDSKIIISFSNSQIFRIGIDTEANKHFNKLCKMYDLFVSKETLKTIEQNLRERIIT